jgi:glycosyltransferase involved in cell wall biosynthesis
MYNEIKVQNPRQQMKILLIGPLPPPLGGVSILFNNLATELKNIKNLNIELFNTGNIRGKGILGVFRLISLICLIAKSARSADVISLHSATSGLHILGPLLVLLAMLTKKPIIIRKFGGTDFFESNFIKRYLILWSLHRSTLYLAETKYLVNIAQENGLLHAYWYSNSRPMQSEELINQRKDCKRFIYIGQIKREKGIMEIIYASERLKNGIIVDIYGPLDFDVSKEAFNGRKIVRYCGIVKSEHAIQLLNNYDALLLPTYYPGEGYPGVILEAYSAGLPIICTRWKALPEIVSEETGILIEPRCVEALYIAMNTLIKDPALFYKLCKGVSHTRKYFASSFWTDQFIEYCKKAITEIGHQ